MNDFKFLGFQLIHRKQIKRTRFEHFNLFASFTNSRTKRHVQEVIFFFNSFQFCLILLLDRSFCLANLKFIAFLCLVAGKIYAFEECYNLAITDLCIDFVAINDLIALGICPLWSCLFLGIRYCYCHNNILWLFDSFRVLCKFFAHGACLKGEHCEFSHDWKDPPNNVKISCSITFFTWLLTFV